MPTMPGSFQVKGKVNGCSINRSGHVIASLTKYVDLAGTITSTVKSKIVLFGVCYALLYVM